MSQMDEFEHFIMGRTQNNTEHEDGLSCGEMETNSFFFVMKEVMGRAEAKFGHLEGVVQRAQDEAHERAATEANERAERAAADARKKASVQAKEKEAWESVLQRLEKGLLQLQGTGLGLKEQGGPPGSSSSMRKASSTTNVVDALTSIFGASPSSSEFQEVEDDSEERVRARLEGHQRAQERACSAKALVEKNRWDFQTRGTSKRHVSSIDYRSWLALILDIEAPPLLLMKWSGFQVGLQHV
ncbi:hypothetical protein AAG906_029271 [Vitis piasezkii]